MNIKTFYHCTFIAVLTHFSAVAVAEDTFSYSFVQGKLGIAQEEVDGFDDDVETNILTLNGAYNIAKHFAITASYTQQSGDGEIREINVDLEADTLGVGGLFHMPIGARTDFIAGAEYLQSEVSFEVDLSLIGSGDFSVEDDINGTSLFVGVRSMVTPQVELNGKILRSDFEESDASHQLDIGASYYINPLFTVDAGLSLIEEGQSVSIGLTKFF